MKILSFIPKNLNLGKKLTALIFALFLIGILAVGGASYNIFYSYAEKELISQANIIMSTLNSVRQYNQNHITSLLVSDLDKKFVVESIPSYAAQQVFKIFSESYKELYQNYKYKDALLNPNNDSSQATPDEVIIIGKLQQQDELKSTNIEQKGYSIMNSKKYFYTALPIKITNPQCLECHSTLAKAPKSVQALYQQGKYGAGKGFGWELNKIIGTQIVYIPASEVYTLANRNFFIILGIFITIFLIVMILTNLWLKQYVVQPIDRIVKIAEAVSLGDMEASFDKKFNDEIGRLVEAFNRLKNSLKIALKRLNKNND